MQETRTARLAAERLRAAGYDVTTGIGKTGVVGLLRNGDGPMVMLRADMDALPVKEATGCRMRAPLRPPTVRARPYRWRMPAVMTCMWLGWRAPVRCWRKTVTNGREH
jgi:metal-dependent amidase/aminoacylase/carboxypeptidase family protein